MPSTSLGPYTRLEVAALPVAGLIVKGTTVTPGALQGGRIRRVQFTNKSVTGLGFYPMIFCDPTNCGTTAAPSNVPANSMVPGNPVILPTSATTVPSYTGPLLTPGASSLTTTPGTTLGVASQGQAVTAGTPFTLTVANTAGFPASGSVYVMYTTGAVIVTYTAIGSSTTFTGAYGPTGTTVSAAAPVVLVAGSVPGVSGQGSFGLFDFGPDGIAAPGGIILAGSTTANVFTAMAATDATVTIDYR